MSSFRKRIARFLGFGKAAPTKAPVVSEISTPDLELLPGDVIVQQDDDGSWKMTRILALDLHEGYSATAHCLVFESSSTKPALDSIASARPMTLHAPICADSYRTGWTRLGNTPVQKEELEGFYFYLKWTNFPRYLQETGQSLDVVFAEAEQHYLRANSLAEEEKRREAIEEYDRAIDLCPPFIEAIDNRAFTYMELGDYARALQDFELSLRFEPDGSAAFFSRGECLMRLGALDKAEAIFREGLIRFWEKRELFQKFLERTLALKSQG